MKHDRGTDDSGVWAWGPYAVTAGVAGFGWLLRLAAGGIGLAVAAGLLLVPPIVLAVAYARGRYLLGVGRRGELVYAAGCLIGLAGWVGAAGMTAWPEAALVAATVTGCAAGWQMYGPGQRPAGLSITVGFGAAVVAGLLLGATRQPNPARWAVVWLAGTSLAAAPWWRDQRNRRRPVDPPPQITDVQLLTHAIVKHLHAPIEVVPDSLTAGEDGRYSVRYRLTDGRTARHVQALIEQIESELGCRAGAVQVEGARARRDEVTVTVVPTDPARKPMVRPDPPITITQPVPLGRHDTGEPMQLAVYSERGARGGVIGGQKESGKSRTVWTLMAGWTHTRDAIQMMGDLSGGATSEPWLPCLAWRETEPDKVLVQIEALTAAARARAAVLPGRGWESWQPSPAEPAIQFVIDEAQVLLKDNYAAQAALSQLMQIDRKSGISVVIVMPVPVMTEGLGRTVREQCKVRICHASPGAAADWVLGDTPAAPIRHLVSEFDTPGQLLGVAPGLAPLPGRAHDTPLAEAKATAVRNAAHHGPPDRLTADALRSVAGDALPADLSYAGPVAKAAGGAPGDRWTDADDRALWKVSTVSDEQLRDQLRTGAEQRDVLGRAWPDRPQVDPIPKGRLNTEQALQVAAAMLAQPGGTTPAALRRATGRSESWTFDLLAKWTKQGVARQTPDRRYIPATTPTAAGDSDR